MTSEAIGAIPANPDNQPINQDCSSGFRRGLVTGVDLGDPIGDRTVVAIDADGALKRIAEELSKPQFAFERTFDGVRYTRRVRNG